MKNVHYKVVGDGYECTKNYTYFSPRFKKEITIPKGFYSDGATAVVDLDTDAWWVHDVFCRYGCWDDGTRISNWDASTVLYDLLNFDGFWFRAPLWRFGSFLFGGGAARDNGLWSVTDDDTSDGQRAM